MQESSASWQPSEQPTVLIVREAMLRTTFGWRFGELALLAMPTGPETTDSRPILCPGGHAMLVPLREGVAEPGGVHGGLTRVDLQTGASALASFKIPISQWYGFHFGGSPDGSSVAVNTMWREGQADWSVQPPRLPTE